MNDVITGRKKLADFEAIVSTFRTGGGDKIRTEYEEAYAATR